ncbi:MULTISPECIES: NAD(P)H-binding protein [Nocardioides]|uniref:NAD(P)H-binding protein n=1 Tax=Nocardioides vastitatis TaxID=2568655 RepID=A0ABW0ZJG5_9ACTN|nr:NAD(P)H-binding protein [Nocardioides sp.]THJ01213.1 NAD-dependent epimerase/dehydratase family protein [Nocardioides sp.]
MTIVVTGATGQLGRLVVESLLERGAPPADIVATGRAVDRIADLADRGVQVRQASYDDPASLAAAFAGADRVLLVSSDAVGQRLAQHQNAIDAAKAAGAELIAYTSIANADRGEMMLAKDHGATEQAVIASGLPYTLLRNGWYLENYAGQIPTYLEHGAVLGSAGQGRVSAATRADLADAAAAVLLTEQPRPVYELGGDTGFTLAELAAAVADASGREVTYQDLPAEQYTQILVGAGVPAPFAEVLADSDLGLGRGELEVTSGDLSALLGRPTTPMPEAVRVAVGALTGA